MVRQLPTAIMIGASPTVAACCHTGHPVEARFEMGFAGSHLERLE